MPPAIDRWAPKRGTTYYGRMRIAITAVAGLFVVAATAGSPSAWGFDVHRFITNAAMDHVPEPIRPYFQKHRAFITEHAIDPDLTRLYGVEAEAPDDFLGPAGIAPDPVSGMPRDEAAYIELLGPDKARQFGRLPWRLEEVYGKLVEELQRPEQGRTISSSNVNA